MRQHLSVRLPKADLDELEAERLRRGEDESLTRVVIERLRAGKMWHDFMRKIKPSEHSFLNKILNRK